MTGWEACACKSKRERERGKGCVCRPVKREWISMHKCKWERERERVREWDRETEKRKRESAYLGAMARKRLYLLFIRSLYTRKREREIIVCHRYLGRENIYLYVCHGGIVWKIEIVCSRAVTITFNSFLKIGPTPTSFSCFWSFQTNKTFFTTIQCEKCHLYPVFGSRIRTHDLLNMSRLQ